VSARCTRPAEWQTLVEYWAGELSQPDEQALEEHLFGCEACSQRSGSVAAISEGFRGMLPPILSPERLAELRARGMTILESHFAPSERKEVPFPAEVELMVHNLGGLPLEHATRVSFSLYLESDPARMLMAFDDVPFDRANGRVLLACQQHYAAFPPDTVAELQIHGADDQPRSVRYTILHRYA
jgi:Putative zinc-finger